MNEVIYSGKEETCNNSFEVAFFAKTLSKIKLIRGILIACVCNWSSLWSISWQLFWYKTYKQIKYI